MGYDETLRGFEESAGKLDLEQIDMFLIHWPVPELDRYADTWRALVRLREEGRVRLCPYYFVEGQGDAARAKLCGVLATIAPADKKIIHGMRDAVLAPVSVE